MLADVPQMSWFTHIKISFGALLTRWSKEHLIAFVEIAFILIFSHRLKRLVVKELSA
jgi:hypothetical protein